MPSSSSSSFPPTNPFGCRRCGLCPPAVLSVVHSSPGFPSSSSAAWRRHRRAQRGMTESCGARGTKAVLRLLLLDACLELNASDERGIDVVRERIKRFASTKVTLPTNMHKIVILDEADSMTEGAQQALRRIMEIYSLTTRFAFACNQSDKIIEPLQSRCAIIKFGKLSDEQLLSRMLHVCSKENVQYTDKGLNAILYTAQGDMRQALNNMQCTVASYDSITEDHVYKVCDEPHPNKINEIFELCMHGQTREAFQLLDALYKMGYSIDDLIGMMFKNAKTADIPEAVRYKFIMEIGKCHLAVLQGVTTRLQLAGLIGRLSNVQEELAMED